MTFTYQTIASVALLLPLGAVVTYTDVRFRRIPNRCVLAVLVSGLTLNTVFGGFGGLLASLGGCALAFALMFVLHLFGAMGAGDVKLFAAIGSVVGLSLVPQTFALILATGFVIAIFWMFRSGVARATTLNVFQFFAAIAGGWERPKFEVPTDRRRTIPYGVAITVGSLISLFVFRA